MGEGLWSLLAEDKPSLHYTDSALWIHLFKKTGSDGGCKSPHIISPAFQWARALTLQATFTRQPTECGRWKAGAHLPSHMYMAKINSGLLSLATSAIYYCGQGTQESAFCFLWELCSALQCCDCARHVFLWLTSSSSFLTFLSRPKVYASQVKQWSVSTGATWSCNGSSGQRSHGLWSMLTRHRGRRWWQLLCTNWYNLGLSLEEEG